MSTTQTHKEALTLARQLLWRYRHETPVGNQPYMICQEVDEAFERIDEALMSFQDGAQPEQEPIGEVVTAGVIRWKDKYPSPGTKLYTTPPQSKEPEQEPVAHTAVFHCPNCEYPHRQVTHITGTAQPPWSPQRKRLTHEQRLDVMEQFASHQNKWSAISIMIDLVEDAIEAAHGIKEKNT